MMSGRFRDKSDQSETSTSETKWFKKRDKSQSTGSARSAFSSVDNGDFNALDSRSFYVLIMAVSMLLLMSVPTLVMMIISMLAMIAVSVLPMM
jgi:hypothetical protein